MHQSATRELVTLLSGCVTSDEVLVEIALAQLEHSVEQQILKRLDSYDFSSHNLSGIHKQLKCFQYDTTSITRLYESHEELRKLIRQCGVPFKELATGKFIRFGYYLNEPVIWRILQVEQSGRTLLLSENIVTIKPFSSSRGNEPLGSTEWNQSSLKEWLNSTTVKVQFTKDAPVKKNVWMEVNPYSKEKGFLYQENFNSSETSLLATFPDSDDKVRIPGIQEYNLMIARGMETVAKPTTAAVKQAAIQSSSLSFALPWSYWLSDAAETTTLLHRVNGSGELKDGYPYDGTVGVRIMVLLRENARFTGKGNREEPYSVSRR